MEGPTPSSAVFYGALSVHLGVFLLLRVSPILDASGWLCAAVVVLGLTTAFYAALCTRVQTDVKSVLAFASLTQVGIITVEIGAGLRYIALVHIIGHACLRTLQLLRAPTFLHDCRTLENAMGASLPRSSDFAVHWVPRRMRRDLYRLAWSVVTSTQRSTNSSCDRLFASFSGATRWNVDGRTCSQVTGMSNNESGIRSNERRQPA